MFETTALYAAPLGIAFTALSLRVSLHRLKLKCAVGDQGDPGLATSIRLQQNFIEYVPITLILLALCEAQGAAGWTLHLAGLSLLVSRAAHYRGYATKKGSLTQSFAMVLCYGLMIGLSVFLLGLRFL